MSEQPISPTSNDAKTNAVNATNTAPGGFAVYGYCAHGHGVHGDSEGSKGVVGTSADFQGVYGHSGKNAGVVGESATWVGVYGKSMGDPGIAVMGDAGLDAAASVAGNGTGVLGVSTNGHGVEGGSVSSDGVVGTSTDGIGVHGASTHGPGVNGTSENGEGVHAQTNSSAVAAIAAINTNGASIAAAIYAEKAGPAGDAGFFKGNVTVTGTVIAHDFMFGGADVAEQFEVVDESPTGSVVVLDEDSRVKSCALPYDSRVVGIISGLGDRKPALVLDRMHAATGRQPVAVMGKAWCLADAGSTPIHVGDLLTTSPRLGHAMRAVDQARAFGAIIGKALTPLESGQGQVLVLVGIG